MKKQPKPIYRKDYESPHFFIETVDLYFNIFDHHTEVTAKTHLKRNQNFKNKSLVLDGEHLILKSIKLNDHSLTPECYHLTDEKLTIEDVPDDFELEIVTHLKPHENTALTGLYQSNHLFCTQCEAHGFRRITYFIDRPDVMSRYTTTIEADKKQYPVLLSNGNPVESGDCAQNRHWVKWQDPFKKPCYLFALVAGDLDCLTDSFTTRSGKSVTLKIFSEKGKSNKCEHAMHALKQAMKWDEVEFGREYDLDIFMIVAVSDFNMGAMENKGLNIFNDKYILADPKTATDTDYEAISVVVAHEYFHNWTGNRITCRDWFQLSLKEGLTVYRDQEFCAFISSPGVTRIDDVRILRSAQFIEDAGPLAHPVRPESYIEMNNFYTSTVYNKGAEVIRMMRTILGKDGFRKGMDLYFERHDGQAVTCDDFVKAMEDANQIDLTQFRLWYSQAGTPEVTANYHYDTNQQKFYLDLTQDCPPTPNQPTKNPMDIPVQIGLLDLNGEVIQLNHSHAQVLRLKQEKMTFCFESIAHKPIPSVLQNFSAPVKLKINYPDDELAILWEHDVDPFNQWEAGQRVAIKTILNLVPNFPNSLKIPENFMNSLAALMLNKSLDKALLALMLALPTEIYLGTLMHPVAIKELHGVRKFMREQIAKQLENLLLDLYYQQVSNGPYEFTPKASGIRSLKNICLNYLCQLPDESMRQMAFEQFKTADNMTDETGAVVAVNNIDCPERKLLLNQFYEKWKHEPLVLDKWFMLQAQSELPDTLAQVKELMLHEAFTLKNPNRVRALIAAFCSGNQRWFHDDRGEGYEFLKHNVIQLNKINPQIAARITEPLTQWRRFDNQRQKLMRQQLEEIAKTPNLSKDVYEIVTKSLEQ